MVNLAGFAAEIVECCPLCSGKGEFVFNAPTPYLKKTGTNKICLDVYTCPDCNTSYNSPRMTREAMRAFYSSGEYFDHVTDIRRNRGSFGERRRALKLMLIIMNLTNMAEPTRHLDVGCAQGHFLQRMKDWSFGVETVGYDAFIDPGAVHEIITDKSKITGEFDLISCIHTLEHVYDPMEELEWMHSLLAIDGVLVLELPIIRYILLEHPIMFSIDSIHVMMKQVGIENYSWIHIPTLESCFVFGKKVEKADD